MGGAGSRRRKPNTPIPPYTPAGGGTPGISRPGAALNTGVGGGSPINRDQQRELMQANQTIQNLNALLNTTRGGGMGGPPMPYGGYPPAGPNMPYGAPGYQYPGPNAGPPPTPYGTPYMPGQYPPYGPPSPLMNQRGLPPNGYSPPSPPQLRPPMPGAAVYRDTDFASVAKIAGLNPSDVALLHQEFMRFTRGGSNRIDRVVFRDILRDALLDINSENVDRAVENIFVSVDRNRDGFIDFPEFVGAFKDVLKPDDPNSYNYSADQNFPDTLADQLRASGVGSGVAPQPIAVNPSLQFAPAGGFSIVPLASMGIQQAPLVYGGGAAALPFPNATPPLLTLDPNQSTYVIATPGQYMITQPTALQCVPLPIM